MSGSPPPDGFDEWVTLSRHIAVVDAELERAHLAAAGIESQIVGAPFASMLPTMATAIDLRITVRAKDLETAREILAAGTDGDDGDEGTDAGKAAPTEEPDAEPRSDTTEGDAGMRRAAGAAVFGFFICPPLALYAISILITQGSAVMSASGRRYRALAYAAALVTIAIWGFLLFGQLLM